MEGLRFPELLVILLLIAVLFGPQKIAGLGAGLGKAIRDFKDAMNGKEGEEHQAMTRAKDSAPSEPPAKHAVAKVDPESSPPIRPTEHDPAAKQQ